jgi:hypothetical protein
VAYRDEVLVDSPLGYWRLGESSGTVAQDETTNNLDLTYSGSPTLGVTGAVVGDTAVSFSGSGQQAYSASGILSSISDTFSYEFWLKRNNTTAAVQGLFSDGAVEGRLTASGNLAFRDVSKSPDLATSSTTITDTNWHHIVFTKSGLALKVWVDSVDRTTLGTNSTIPSHTQALNWALSQTAYGNVTLDECAIYPTALSQTRVQAHYNATGQFGWTYRTPSGSPKADDPYTTPAFCGTMPGFGAGSGVAVHLQVWRTDTGALLYDKEFNPHSLDFAQGFFAWSVVHCPATECKAKYRLKDSLGAYGPFSAETTFIGGGGA